MRRALVIAGLLGFAPWLHAGVLSTMTAVPMTDAPRKYDAATVKPADLKSCVVDAYSIDAADAVFEAERPRVEQEREELRKLRDATRGAPTNASAAAEKDLRSRTRTFNAKIAELNSRVAYAQDARDRFSRQCKGRRYYLEDLHDLRGRLPAEIAAIIPG